MEIETVVGKDGIIKIPKKELKASGLKEGNETFLLYFARSEENRRNEAGECIWEKEDSQIG